MEKTIKKIYHKIFDPIALKLGYISKTLIYERRNTNVNTKQNLLNNFFTLLKSINFYPKHIVDVGANHGTWTREALVHFPKSVYTLLDPQKQMEDFMGDLLQRKSNVFFYPVGAGKEPGVFDFTIADRDDSCTFVFSKEEADEKQYKQIKATIITLNEFIKNKNLPAPDIIKIDAEGFDMDVLMGASDFFGKTEVFLVEAGIVNKRINNSFLEVINFMDKNNYRLFDITDLNRPFNHSVLWLTELVFVKKNGNIDCHKWFND